REIKKRDLQKEEVELDLEEDENYMDEARTKLVGVKSSNFNTIRKGLIERLVSTDTSYKLDTIDEYAVRGFQLQQKIFPLKEFYNISILNKAIRAVINKGQLGAVFLSHSYDVEDFFDEEFETKQDDDSSDLGYIG
ncbi:MAG: hypothetical protein ABEJ98_00745, partial [Candidatus Nanohaloarchaea archaeon]